MFLFIRIEIAAPIAVPKVLLVAAIRGRAKSMPIIIIRKVMTVIEDASLCLIALHSHMRKTTPKTHTKMSAREEKTFAFIRLSTTAAAPPRKEPSTRLMPKVTEFSTVSCIQITDDMQAKLGEVPRR